MTGYSEGHEAVEFYKGGWILRTALAGDRPISESGEAQRALDGYHERNKQHVTSGDPAAQ